MKTIDFNVKEPYLEFMKTGKKTIEGRLNKGKFHSLTEGDKLRLTDGSELKFEVIGKRNYDSFAEMIDKEGINNVIPDKETIESARQVYYQFYTPEQERKFGVVAIEVCHLEN